MAGLLTLESYIGEQARRRYAWGEHDCILFVADWIALYRGVDLAADMRGSYNNEIEGKKLFAGHGGLPRLIGKVMRRAGFMLTRTPVRGDAAMVAFGDKICCAICTGPGWAARLESGITVSRYGRMIAAWAT